MEGGGIYLCILNVLGTFDPFNLVTKFLNCINEGPDIARHIIQQLYFRHRA